MPVIIRNLIVNAEIGKAETKNNQGSPRGRSATPDANKQRILKLEELTDQLLQIIKDQKER